MAQLEQLYYSERLPRGVTKDGYEDGLQPISPVHLEATISLPTGDIVSLATLTMMSMSQHRETFPVTSLGYVRPQGFTRGHRLIAGTLVFSVFERSAFMSLVSPLSTPSSYANKRDEIKQLNSRNAFVDMPADQLPPFDIHAVYVTPQGMTCYEGLRGVVIVDEGSIRSIDMPQIQESYSYMAMERIPLQRLADNTLSPSERRNTFGTNKYTKNLINFEVVRNAQVIK